MTREPPRLRPDLIELSGYHSPQVEVQVRLNTNESPIGPPTDFRREVADAVAAIDWHRYPDRSAEPLRAAIAARHEIESGMVFVANGSNEVLQSTLLAFGGSGRSAAVFEPTYALHRHIALITGTSVITGARTEDFGLDDDELERVFEQRPDVVFLCSPNNPTGRLEPRPAVEHVLDRVEAWGGLLIVDEAYGQFASWSASELVGDRNLLVTRTFSKTWAMAGARLGYCIGGPGVIAGLELVALPYHLDAVTQIAGAAALRYEAEMHERIAGLIEERGRIEVGLGELDCTVWPSDANFVLFRPDPIDGEKVWQSLLERSVLVRNCSSWAHLDGCLRVTVGSPEENTRFLAALGEIVGRGEARRPSQ